MIPAAKQLFGRRATLTVASLRIEQLRFKFAVSKKLKKGEANKCEVHVYNLTEAHRAQLEQMAEQDIPVTLEAGYVSGTSVIFQGYVRSVVSTRDGADIVTKVGGGDGEKQMQTARVSKSFAAGAPASEFFRFVAKSIGVSEGNSAAAVSLLSQEIGSSFGGGTVFFGSAERELSYLCRSFGLDWSVQDGKLQIIRLGGITNDKAIRLSQATGLIEIPSVDAKGVLSAKSLIQPGITPGRLIVLDAERLKGNWRIEEAEHRGDTMSQSEWWVQIKGSKF